MYGPDQLQWNLMKRPGGGLGGMKQPLIASLECRAVCLRSVGVCLLALGYVKMLTGDLLGEMNMPYVVGWGMR